MAIFSTIRQSHWCDLKTAQIMVQWFMMLNKWLPIYQWWFSHPSLPWIVKSSLSSYLASNDLDRRSNASWGFSLSIFFPQEQFPGYATINELVKVQKQPTFDARVSCMNCTRCSFVASGVWSYSWLNHLSHLANHLNPWVVVILVDNSDHDLADDGSQVWLSIQPHYQPLTGSFFFFFIFNLAILKLYRCVMI